nr:tRNA (N6-threonylcarbamoyladenosine(37)-N6)-methyltransferase TrmO [uncultured Psychrobacter sp.]
MAHVLPIIGYHRAPLSQKFGVPRQPNLVAVPSIIEMIAPFNTPAAFSGLEAFSHIWVSWQFHHNDIKAANNNETPSFRAQVRPPRLGGNQKIGVFASRSMYRPSALGLSVVKLERIDIIEGRVLLLISGADMIEGTPIVDIKPYIAYSDALKDTSSGFAPIAPISLDVEITPQAFDQILSIIDAQNKGDTQKTGLNAMIDDVQTRLTPADIEHIKALIAQDPRPAYRRCEIGTTFIMRYKSVDISFSQIEAGQLQVTAITAL